MSDFFTRLAARTLGLAPTLQPIIAPIFAQEQWLQQPDADQLEFFAEEEIPHHNGDTTGHDRHGLTQHAASQISPVSPPKNSQHDRQQPNTLKKDHSSLPMPRPTISEQVSVQDDHAQHNRQNHSHIPNTDQQPVSMQQPSTPEPLQQHPMSTTTRETHFIQEDMTINTNTTGRHHTPEIRSARSLPPIERNVPVPLTTEHGGSSLAAPQMPVPSPKHGGSSHAVGYSMAGRGTANHGAISHVPVNQPPIQPVPTIQVTIGRVEVRATPPPPPPATSRQTPAPAVKSLDDYLRQREEGRVR